MARTDGRIKSENDTKQIFDNGAEFEKSHANIGGLDEMSKGENKKKYNKVLSLTALRTTCWIEEYRNEKEAVWHLENIADTDSYTFRLRLNKGYDLWVNETLYHRDDLLGNQLYKEIMRNVHDRRLEEKRRELEEKKRRELEERKRRALKWDFEKGQMMIKKVIRLTNDGSLVWKCVLHQKDSVIIYHARIGDLDYSLYCFTTGQRGVVLKSKKGVYKYDANHALTIELCEAVRNNIEKNKGKQKRSKQPTNEKAKNTIDLRGDRLIVRSNLWKCRSDRHKLRSLVASIKIRDKNGRETSTSANVAYCEKCNCYIMHDDDYERVSSKGRILLPVQEYSVFANGGKNSLRDIKNGESILKKAGYTVAENKKLTSRMRQQILAGVMNKGTLTAPEVLSYLEFFKASKKNQPNCQHAIQKWNEDIQFVMAYQTSARMMNANRKVSGISHRKR